MKSSGTEQTKNFLIILAGILLLSGIIIYTGAPIKRTNEDLKYFPQLTFDDGPGAETITILDVLDSQNATAVFFVTCAHIDIGEHETIKRMADDGHIVAIHGYDHSIFQSVNDIEQCKRMIENITNREVEYFRPPYGFPSPQMMIAAKKMNMTIILWSVFPKDYLAEHPDDIIDKVTDEITPKSIVCLHDGPAERTLTADALPEIIVLLDSEKKIEITD